MKNKKAGDVAQSQNALGFHPKYQTQTHKYLRYDREIHISCGNTEMWASKYKGMITVTRHVKSSKNTKGVFQRDRTE